MSRDLRLQVILGAVDRVTGPIKRITEGNSKLRQQFKETRSQLSTLERQQRSLQGFKAMQADLTKTSVNMDRARQRVRELTLQMNAGEGRTKKFQQQLARANTKAQALYQTFQKKKLGLNENRAALEAAGISTRNLGQAEKLLGQNLQRTNAQLATQRARLDAVAQRQRRVQALNQQHGQQMMHIGMVGAGGYAAQAAGQRAFQGISSVLAPGLGFDEIMSELQAVSRLGKDDEAFLRLRQQARELGATTAFTAGDVGSAQVFLARAGFSPEAISMALGDMLNLAMANGVDLGRTADIASNISGAFSIDPSVEGNMRRVADVLSAAAARANVDLEMLGESMKYLGAAEGLDYSLEQAAAMAGLLGNIGIQGSQAGTTLRAMLSRLSAPMGKATQAMEQLGLETMDENGNLRDIVDILGDVAWAVDDLGSAERAGFLKRIFGDEAGSGMAKLVADHGTGELVNLISELEAAQGESARMAQTRMDNLAGDLKSLTSAWHEASLEISDINKGSLRELAVRITEIVRRVGQWLKANPELVRQISMVVGGVTAALVVFGTLAIVVASVLAPFAILRFVLMRLGIGVLPMLASGLKALSVLFYRMALAAIPAAISALRMLAVATMAHPILALITAVAAGALLIWQNWDTIGPKLKGVWDGMLEWLSPIWEAVTGGLSATWDNVASGADRLWTNVKEVFSGGVGEVARVLLNWSPLGDLWRVIAESVEQLGVEIPEQFKTLGGAIIDGLIGGLRDKMGDLRNTITGMGEGIGNWFRDPLGIRSPSRVFAQFGDDTLTGYQQGLARTQPNVMRQLQTLGQRVAVAGSGLALASGMAAQPLVADTRAPLSMSGAPVQIQSHDVYHLQVNALPGMDEAALTALLSRMLDEREREKARRLRSQLYD